MVIGVVGGMAEEPRVRYLVTAQDILALLMHPRRALRGTGLEQPDDCRIETVIENHDWLIAHTNGLQAANGPIVVCNVGGGNVATSVNCVSMDAHHEGEVGKIEKQLLDAAGEAARDLKRTSPTSQG